MIVTSVIITTKNEELNIANCFESVKNQSYAPDMVEVIVVDNNSSDKTIEIARRYTDKVYTCGPERSSQRNFGTKQASGKYVLYLDADMILSENVISECIDKCEREGLIALYIPERITGDSFWIKVRDFERSFYNATAIDCVRFVRRDRALEINGFDETLIGPEDWDFDRRIKALGKVGIAQNPLFHNEGKFNLKKYLGKKAYYAKSFSRYIAKWGRKDKIIKRQFGFFYRYIGVFIEKGKIFKLLAHPLLSMGMYILRFLVGINYVFNKTGQIRQ